MPQRPTITYYQIFQNNTWGFLKKKIRAWVTCIPLSAKFADECHEKYNYTVPFKILFSTKVDKVFLRVDNAVVYGEMENQWLSKNVRNDKKSPSKFLLIIKLYI